MRRGPGEPSRPQTARVGRRDPHFAAAIPAGTHTQRRGTILTPDVTLLRTASALVLIACTTGPLAAGERSLEARLAEDRSRIESWRSFQTSLLAEMERLLLRSEGSTLSSSEIEQLRSIWAAVVDLQLSLDVIDRRWRDRANHREGSLERAVTTSFAAWLARLNGATTAVNLGRAHPDMQLILNEPLPQLGLPAGTWGRMVQNAEAASTNTEFLGFEGLYRSATRSERVARSPAIDDDAARLRKWLQERGVEQSAVNARRLLGMEPGNLLATITSMPSPWLGSAHNLRRTRPLISDRWTRNILAQIQPGDIVLVRHEWDTGDAGHSSYWSQAAVWVGTPAERRHYYGDPATLATLRSEGAEDLDALVRSRAPSAYGTSLGEGSEPMRAIITTPLGVSFVSAELVAADSLAVLRLRAAPMDRARVILRAFELAGRPHDAAATLDADDAIGPAELILRALGEHAPRISRPRAAIDDLVEWYDTAEKNEGGLELVLFIDGSEATRSARFAEPDEFRKTWLRPAWRTWLSQAAMRQLP